jgi:sugar phosphate permease
VNSLSIDLAPVSLVGSLAGIQNCFGSIGGTLAPIVTGYIVNATGSFVNAFVVAGAMAMFGAISFVLIMKDVEGGLEDPGPPAAAIQVSHSTVL